MNQSDTKLNLLKENKIVEGLLKSLCMINKESLSKITIDLTYGDELDDNILNIFNILQKLYEQDSQSNFSRDYFKLDIPYYSDGEKLILDIFSKILNIYENDKRDLHIIIMDEPDQRLHPEWSRLFISLVVDAIKKINNELVKNKAGKLQTQLIICTHSPFLLSDVREEDILLLEEPCSLTGKAIVNQKGFRTFGANIHDILQHQFFLKSGTIGDFAMKKMKEDFNILKIDEEEFVNLCKQSQNTYKNKDSVLSQLSKAKYLIDRIGEPLMRDSLYTEYYKRMELYCEITDTSDDFIKVNEMIENFSSMGKKEKKIFLKRVLEIIES